MAQLCTAHPLMRSTQLCQLYMFSLLGNLPTNWAGVALIILAIVLLVAELNTDATGVLGTGATVAFLLGGLLLFRPLGVVSPTLPQIAVDPWILGISTALFAGFILLVVGQLARTRRAPLRTGYEHYIGQIATVHRALTPRGSVWFEGQLWHATERSGQNVPVQQPMRIVDIDGLTLIVEPAPSTVPPDLKIVA